MPDRRRKYLLVLALLAVAVVSGIVSYTAYARSSDRAGEIIARSVQVDGYVVAVERPLRGAKQVVVRYRVGDRHHEESVSIYNRDAVNGSGVVLRYDPQHPERVRDAGDPEPPGGEPGAVFVTAGAIALICANIAARILFRLWRTRRDT